MERLAQKNKDKVLDLLAERLSFERASVKLYDKVLERMTRATQEPRNRSDGDYTTYGLSGYGGDAFRGVHDDIRKEQGRTSAEDADEARERERRVLWEMRRQVQTCRDQEKGHEEWLEACIRKLGGNDKRRTEMAKVSAREVTGIEGVIMKDPELPHLFHALLAAEHVDYAGWDLLRALADSAGDVDARAEFEKRLHEEEQHLAFVRDALRMFAAHDILQEELRSPTLGGAPAAH
jgi:ferritin-like metal-binding protein YciE